MRRFPVTIDKGKYLISRDNAAFFVWAKYLTSSQINAVQAPIYLRGHELDEEEKTHQNTKYNLFVEREETLAYTEEIARLKDELRVLQNQLKDRNEKLLSPTIWADSRVNYPPQEDEKEWDVKFPEKYLQL